MSENKKKGIETLEGAQEEEIYHEVGIEEDGTVYLFFKAGSKHFRTTMDKLTAIEMGQGLVAAGNGIVPKRTLPA